MYEDLWFMCYLLKNVVMKSHFPLLFSFDDVCCLSKAVSLIELSFDGNPLTTLSGYKQTILQNVTTLRQLDMKRLSV